VTLAETAAIAKEFFSTESIAFAAVGDLKGVSINRGRLSIEGD